MCGSVRSRSSIIYRKQHEQLKVLADYVIAQGRDKLCEQVDEITGAKVLGLFTDIDVQLGERVFVFTMDRELQNGNR